jgi:glutamate dehydrogenase/leucine dehydrogenase
MQLEARGARVVCASDSSGAVYDPDGLHVQELVDFTRSHLISEYADAKPMPRDDLLTVECDVLVPAATADVIHEGNADLVRAHVVLQGANLPVTAAAEATLARRGILSVPDVIANAGGVICAAMEYRGGIRTQAFAEISERIRANTAELLDRLSKWDDLLPSKVAVMMARSRLDTASAYRRRF